MLARKGGKQKRALLGRQGLRSRLRIWMDVCEGRRDCDETVVVVVVVGCGPDAP